jgi:hypothetical protein
VIMTEHYTQNNCRSLYKFTRLSVGIFEFVCEKINLTSSFLPPVLNIALESAVTKLAELDDSLAEVLIGKNLLCLPLWCLHLKP